MEPQRTRGSRGSQGSQGSQTSGKWPWEDQEESAMMEEPQGSPEEGAAEEGPRTGRTLHRTVRSPQSRMRDSCSPYRHRHGPHRQRTPSLSAIDIQGLTDMVRAIGEPRNDNQDDDPELAALLSAVDAAGAQDCEMWQPTMPVPCAATLCDTTVPGQPGTAAEPSYWHKYTLPYLVGHNTQPFQPIVYNHEVLQSAQTNHWQNHTAQLQSLQQLQCQLFAQMQHLAGITQDSMGPMGPQIQGPGMPHRSRYCSPDTSARMPTPDSTTDGSRVVVTCHTPNGSTVRTVVSVSPPEPLERPTSLGPFPEAPVYQGPNTPTTPSARNFYTQAAQPDTRGRPGVRRCRSHHTIWPPRAATPSPRNAAPQVGDESSSMGVTGPNNDQGDHHFSLFPSY